MKTKDKLKGFLNYKPNKKEKEEIDDIYQTLNDMIEERNQTYPHFNDRTLIQYINDSEKRIQGYVPTREAQGKDDW